MVKNSLLVFSLISLVLFTSLATEGARSVVTGDVVSVKRLASDDLLVECYANKLVLRRVPSGIDARYGDIVSGDVLVRGAAALIDDESSSIELRFEEGVSLEGRVFSVELKSYGGVQRFEGLQCWQ